MARPFKLTKEKKEELLNYISNGMTYKDAAILSGIGESTLRNWKNIGKEAIANEVENEFSELIEGIAQAKLKYKAWLIKNVNQDAKKDGKLCLEILSRKYPKEWGREIRIEGDLSIKHSNQLAGKTLEELQEELKKIEELIDNGK